MHRLYDATDTLTPLQQEMLMDIEVGQRRNHRIDFKGVKLDSDDLARVGYVR